MKKNMFILGATGFVGRETIKAAQLAGWGIKSLARSAENEKSLLDLGVQPVLGSADDPSNWINEARDCVAVIDLIQPRLPARLGARQIRQVAAERMSLTRRLLEAIQLIPSPERPLLVSVSGLDDLEPDSHRRVNVTSPLKDKPVGFAHIGVPIRREIERMGVASAFVYLGTVYGPGKTFADSIFPQLAKGQFRIAGQGDNRLPFIHVEDAARALVHLAGLSRAQLEGRSFILSDGSGATLSQFMGHAAQLMGVRRPKTAPRWIAALVAGRIMVEAVTRDVQADTDALTGTGFHFRYPSFEEGLPPTLRQLGYLRPQKEYVGSKSSPLAKKTLPLGILLIAVIACVAGINLLDFPLSVPHLQKIADGMVILDMRFHYTPDETYQLFNALGRNGRASYLTLLWTIDLILPSLFSGFLYALWQRGAFARYRLIGLAGGSADYLENIVITVLLILYPVRSAGWAETAAIVTTVKHLLYILAASGGFTGLILAHIRLPRIQRTAGLKNQTHRITSCS